MSYYFDNMVRPCLLDRLRATQVTGIRPNYIYGLLYNWYAASDSRIGNSGFRIPTLAEKLDLLDYVDTQYNVAPNDFGAGNHLKSCRQVNSPLGGDCNTSTHPRWNSNATHYGRNTLNFSLLPGGERRDINGTWRSVGVWFRMWDNDNRIITILNSSGDISDAFYGAKNGLSVRLQRLANPSELLIPEGTIIANYYKGNNNFLYDCVRINDRIWLAQNLSETKWNDGTDIPFAGDNNVNFSNAEWGALTTPGVCAYNNDVSTWAYTLP